MDAASGWTSHDHLPIASELKRTWSLHAWPTRAYLARDGDCDIFTLMGETTATESQAGAAPSLCAQSEWAQAIAGAWAAILASINPLLEQESVRGTVLPWAHELVSALVQHPFDPGVGAEIGARLEAIDSFQPGDLERVQTALLPHLAPSLSEAERDRAAGLLFALGAGFFAAKARRASEFDMSVQSRMSHDLKTPINAITGFSGVILKGIDGPITDFQREDLTSIYEAGQRLLAMINDMFLVRKGDAARTLIHGVPYDVADLLADVARTIQPLAGEHDHTFELRMVGDLDTMAQDASAVRWILLSLINHAIRQAGSSQITLSASRDGEGADTLVFLISYQLPYRWSAHAGTASAAVAQELRSADETAVLTCRPYCEHLGGTVDLLGDEIATFRVCLPAVPQLFLD